MEHNKYELRHYGVKGMRWGHRKAIDDPGEGYTSRRKKKYPAGGSNPRAGRRTLGSADQAMKIGDDMSKALNTVRTAIKNRSGGGSAKAAERSLAKMEKQQMRDFVKQRSKEIQKGESAAGKVWNAITDSHRIQAELEYNLRKYDD